MNKNVMNAIEVLSKQYNFPMDEAMSLFTVKNKSKKTKKDGQSLQDMFAELVNDVEQDNRDPVIVLEPTADAAVAPVKEKKEKAKKQPLSEEEKKQKAEELLAAKEAAKKQKAEELLAAKEAAKKQKAEELLAQKEAAKKQKADELLAAKKQKEEELLAAKKQKADELLAQKEAAKKQKEDEKLAAKEAAKAAKAPKEKAVKAPKEKAVKEPKEKAVKAPKEKAVKAPKENKLADSTSPDRPTPTWVDDMPPIKITVTRVKIGDQTYLKSTAGILYNETTKEEFGLYDEATNTIKPLPEDDEEELEEDTYDA